MCHWVENPGITCFGVDKIPHFRNVSTKMYHSWNLSINYNAIKSVPDFSFLNLKAFSNGSYLTVNLDHNELHETSFGGRAFSGIEDFVIKLDVSWNNLTTIPMFISNLTHLEILWIYGNPIKSVDPIVFMSIQNTLKHLDVDLYRMSTWSPAFQYLTSLEGIAISVMEREIPEEAFIGFNDSLKYLKLMSFIRMPLAVCSLIKLQTFEVEANYKDLSLKNLLNCSSPLESVTNIKFITNFYDRFPYVVFHVFPNVERLEISSCWTNGTTFINDSFIPRNTHLKTVKISFCGLTSIPLSVNKFHIMETCDFSNNVIRRIETSNFDGLQNLQYINLDVNSIGHIAKDAFRNLPRLVDLSLRFNSITTVPQAIEILPSLRHVDLSYNDVNCSCYYH